MPETEFYGLPEYFISHVTTESAGNGNIRVFNFTKRGGILVPQMSCVMAAADLVIASRTIDSAAQFDFEAQNMAEGAVH